MDLLIHNVLIHTNDPLTGVLADQAVLTSGGRITELGRESDLSARHPRCEKLDGGGRLLMPGLINAHMHFYSAFARGIDISARPANFNEILSRLWWKLDRSLDGEAVYYSALLGAITAVKSGVTSVIDHHSSPNAVDGSLDRIEDALKETGLRGVLCYEISDRDGKEVAERSLRENERYARRCISARDSDPGHPFDPMIGLHASFTLDDDTLEKAGSLSRSLEKGCHIHVCEDPGDALISREKYGRGVTERLADNGILGWGTIAAHGIHTTNAEKDVIAATETMLVHNPLSNMNNAVGRTDIFSYLDRGVLTGLGTDGMSPDIRPDARAALFIQKHGLRDSNAGWSETERITLKNNPEIMERVTGQEIGKIAVGHAADLILVDYYPPTPLTSENFWGHFLFGICDARVDTAIINGKTVLRDGKIRGIDEQRIAFEAKRVAKKVWERFDSST